MRQVPIKAVIAIVAVVSFGAIVMVSAVVSGNERREAGSTAPSTTAFVPSADYQVPIFETKGKRTVIGITTATSDPAEVRRVFDNFHDKMQADMASGFDGFDVTIRCTPPAGKERGEILAEGQFARTPIGAAAVGLDSKDVIKFTPHAGVTCT